MLSELERLIFATLQPVLGGGVRAGPGTPGELPELRTEARSWRIDQARVARTTTRLRAHVDGEQTDEEGLVWSLDIPDGVELIEVEAPVGQPLVPWQDYQQERSDDGRGGLRPSLTLMKAAASLRATVAGKEAEGLVERGPAELRFLLKAVASDAAGADQLLGQALPLVLQRLGGTLYLHSEWSMIGAKDPAGGSSLRLHDGRCSLLGVRRAVTEGGVVAEARLRLQGELEIWVARGAAEPASVIREITGITGVEERLPLTGERASPRGGFRSVEAGGDGTVAAPEVVVEPVAEPEPVVSEDTEAARLAAEAEEAARRVAEEAAHIEAARLAAVEEAGRVEAARLAAVEEAARLETARLAAVEEAARIEAARLAAVEEAARIEAARLAAVEEAARIEAARLAAVEEAARLETARLAAVEEAERLEAARLEAERLEAARLAEEEGARLEAARLAAEEAARVEAARLAAEEAARVEAARLAAEEAARIEAARLAAAEEAARVAAAEEAARIEAARLAAEEAARVVAAEEAARVEAARLVAEEAARIEALRLLAENTERARVAAESASAAAAAAASSSATATTNATQAAVAAASAAASATAAAKAATDASAASGSSASIQAAATAAATASTAAAAARSASESTSALASRAPQAATDASAAASLASGAISSGDATTALQALEAATTAAGLAASLASETSASAGIVASLAAEAATAELAAQTAKASAIAERMARVRPMDAWLVSQLNGVGSTTVLALAAKGVTKIGELRDLAQTSFDAAISGLSTSIQTTLKERRAQLVNLAKAGPDLALAASLDTSSLYTLSEQSRAGTLAEAPTSPCLKLCDWYDLLKVPLKTTWLTSASVTLGSTTWPRS